MDIRYKQKDRIITVIPCGEIAESTGLNPDPREDREGPSSKTREGIISVTKDPNNLLWDCDEFRLVLLQQ